MTSPGGSVLGDLAYRIGAAVGRLDAGLRGHAENAAPAGAAERSAEQQRGRSVGLQGALGAADSSVDSLVMSTAGALLLSRLLRPRPVRWPRVILAGTVGALAAELAGRAAPEPPSESSPPHADDPRELMTRLGAGTAIAAGYAALLYPRLPGPPLLRGLLFGALEVAAAPRGGLVRMAASTPGVKFPLKALAAPIDEDAGPASHLAFGLALGLLYRYED